MSSADFFQNQLFQKFFQKYHQSTCQTDWIQIRPDILLGLIWVQSVCKDCEQPSSELLAKLELEDLKLILIERTGFAGLGMWLVLVVQSEQHVIYRLMAGWGQGGPS